MTRPREEMGKPSLAHVRRNDDGSFEIHELEGHLRAVDGQNRVPRASGDEPHLLLCHTPPYLVFPARVGMNECARSKGRARIESQGNHEGAAGASTSEQVFELVG